MGFIVMEEEQLNELIDELFANFKTELSVLNGKLDDVTARLKELTEVGIGNREVFFVDDVAKLMGVKPETVRKNYIQTGKIRTLGKQHKRHTISASEYQRVVNQFKREGVVNGHYQIAD